MRFQDENKVDFNETSQGSSSAEMKEMTQELEILHADGKVMKGRENFYLNFLSLSVCR